MPQAAIWGVGPFTGPPAELMGWELTPSNVGLAPYGIDGNSLPSYTTNPVPANTTITEKKIVWSGGQLDLDAGGITIERCLLQPTSTGTSNLITVQSFSPPSPNRIIDSELDCSLIATQDIAYACGLRGIWSELTRNYIHDVGSGICLVDYDDTITTSSLYVNNLITGLRGFGDPGTTGSHNEAATIRCNRIDLDASRTTVWRGNWIDTSGAPANSSAGMFMQTPPGYGCPVGNVYIHNNYIDGGGNYNVYADGNQYSGVFELVNNRFATPAPFTCAISGFTWTTQSGNSMYDGGNPPDFNGTPVTC